MKRSGGFTLVELLIVVMIIGILAGMVLLAMGPVLDGVEATRVINDIRNVKGAAMAFFLDHDRWPGSETGDDELLATYLDRPLSSSKYAGIIFDDDNWGGRDRQLVGLEFNMPPITTQIVTKIEEKDEKQNLAMKFTDEKDGAYMPMN